MARILALEVDGTAREALERHAADLAVALECSSPRVGLRKLEQDPAQYSVVMVGDAPDPIRTAQQSQMLAPEVPVLLLGTERECSGFEQALRFTAFVGPEVRCVPIDSAREAIRAAIERRQRRRHHVETLGKLNRKLADTPASTARAAAAILGRLLDVAPIGVALTDPEGLVKALNPQGRALLAFSSELIGQPFAAALPVELHPRFRELLAETDANPEAQLWETFELPGADGAKRHLELTAAVLTSLSGGPGYLLLFQDVTERVQLVEQLREANRRKDDFLAMLGHELRNPLAPIRTAIELMRVRADPGTERERTIIERQMHHLVQLVDDLLDVSRITRGKLELELRPLEVADVVTEAVEMTSPLLEERRHELRVDVPRAGLLVLGDRGRLAQVVANLLTNAARYTDPGGCVSVTARPERDEAVITVRDLGRGIDPEVLPHVFDLFVQEKQALDRPSGGLGIGLAIVRSLVELHGGSVSVSSELDRGSEFAVRLPLHAAEGPAPERGLEPAPTTESSAAVHILVVDDNEDAAGLLAELLDMLGYVTKVAYDGPSALAVAETFEPDLALLDLGLPVMDGYELAGRLRALPGLDGLRLVAVTGYGTSADRARTHEAGFDEHLVKPMGFEALQETLERLTGRGSAG